MLAFKTFLRYMDGSVGVSTQQGSLGEHSLSLPAPAFQIVKGKRSGFTPAGAQRRLHAKASIVALSSLLTKAVTWMT